MKKILLLFAIGCYATSLFAQNPQFRSVGSFIEEDTQRGWRLYENVNDSEDKYAVLFSPYALRKISPEEIEPLNKDSIDIEKLEVPASIEHNGDTYRVAAIGQYAYRGCTSLKHIEITEGVDSICKEAFYKCYNLTDINIPFSIISIGTGAFRVDTIDTKNGNLIFRTDSDGNSCLKVISDYAFYFDKTQGTHHSGDLNIPNSVEIIGKNAFTRAFRGTPRGTLHLPENLKELGENAFQGCTGFAGDLIIPGTLSIIQEGTFNNTQNFTSILIEEGVTTIKSGKSGAFQNCTKNSPNATIRIPSTVKTIGTAGETTSVFQGCQANSVDIYATTPPTMNGQQFPTDIVENAKFTIPCKSMNSYQQQIYWKDIKNYILADEEGENTPYPTVHIIPEGVATCTTSYNCETREYTMTLISLDPSYIFSHWEDNSTSTTRKEIIPVGTVESALFTAYFNPEIEVTEWAPSQITIETITQNITAGDSYTVSIGTIQQTGHVSQLDAGIWSINTSSLNLQEHPNETLSIIITTGASTLHFETVIPLIITGTQNISALGTDITPATDVIISTGATLHVDTECRINDLYVYAKGTCTFTAPLTVTTLYLRADVTGAEREFPTMTINRGLTVTSKKMYYDYTLDRTKQYSIVLPVNVNPEDVTHANGDEVAIGIIYYDTHSYKDQDKGFHRVKTQDLVNGFNFERGTCYRIWATPRTWNGTQQRKAKVRFFMPMRDEHRTPTNTRSVEVHGSPITTDDTSFAQRNWNMVGNPFVTMVEGKGDNTIQVGKYEKIEEKDDEWQYINEELRYIVIPDDPDGQSYTWTEAKDYNLHVGEWFFVQVADEGELVFHRKAWTSATNIIARRASEYTSVDKEHSVRLTMTAPDGTSDKTGLLISDLYTPHYDFNADLGKFLSGKESMTFYGVSNAGALFCNAISTDEAETGCQLGYYTHNTSGTFRIKIDDTYDVSDFEGIWLTDNQTGSTVNLLYNTYTFTCSEQQDDTRFSVACKLRQANTPTELDAIGYGAYAWGEQGTLIISRLPEHSDVYVFNTAGQLVYSRQNCSNTTRCAVPQQGCYLIRSTSPTGNQILRTIIK